MVGFQKFVKAIDIFGDNIKLTIKKQETTKTLVGGLTTLLLIGSIIALFVMMSLDILQKQKPIITIENQIQPLHPNLTLTNSTLPISIVLQDAYMNNFYTPEIFTMEAKSITIVIGDNGTTTTIENLQYVLCEPSHFPLLTNDSFYSSGLHFYYCLKSQNVSIGGFYDAKYTKYLALNVKACRNSSDSNVICAQEEEIKAFFSSNTLYWSMYYQNTILNTQLFSNPKSPYIVNIYKTLKYGTSKLFEIFFKTETLYSDNGFLVATNEETNVISYDTSDYDFSDMDQNGYLCQIYIFSSNYKQIYRRSYLKIQAVLAQVGALSEIFIRIGAMYCLIFTRVSLKKTILNKIFDFDVVNMVDQEYQNLKPILLKSKTMKNLFDKKNEDNSIDNNNSPSKLDFDSGDNTINKVDFNNQINGNNNLEIQKSIFDNSNNNLEASKKNILFNSSNDIFPKLNQNSIIAKNDPINILMQIEKKRTDHLKFSCMDIMKGFWCKFLMNPTLIEKFSLYDKSKLVLDDYLDISFIIQKLEELEKLKLVCLTIDQLAVFNYISRDFCTLNDIKNSSAISKYKEFNKDPIKLALIIASFKKRINDNANDLSEIDRKIYDLMRNDLKI